MLEFTIQTDIDLLRSYPQLKDRILKEIAFETIKVAQRELHDYGNKSGRYYTVFGRQIRASSWGETPASKTGNLNRNLDYLVTGDSVIMGSNVHYHKYLENPNILNRPLMSPSLAKVDKDQIIRDNLDDYFGGM